MIWGKNREPEETGLRTYGEPEEKDLRVARAVPSAEAAAWAASEAETVPADLGETLSAETLPLPG